MGVLSDPRQGNRTKRWFVWGLVSIIVAGVLGYIWWASSAHEFRGKLVCRVDKGMAYIPEDPPPVAWLVTPGRTYELVISAYDVGGSNRQLRSILDSMDGKQVIIRGTLGTRRTMMKKHPGAIFVHDLKLSSAQPPAGTASPGTQGGS